MKALSIRLPWAWLICTGHKDIENRLSFTSYRGRIYVHASSTFDSDCYVKPYIERRVPPYVFRTMLNLDAKPLLGAIIGEVTIINCISAYDLGLPGSRSPWFIGEYGLVLTDPELYHYPIPCKGQLGLFEVDLTRPGPTLTGLVHKYPGRQ